MPNHDIADFFPPIQEISHAVQLNLLQLFFHILHIEEESRQRQQENHSTFNEFIHPLYKEG